MKGASSAKASVSESSFLTHSIAPEDAAVIPAMRAAVLPLKGKLQGIAAREPFDGIMEGVSRPEGVAFHTDTVGDISGLWCKPSNARSGDAILQLHGGWFNWGSAQAYRNLVGHIAARTGAEAFVPDSQARPRTSPSRRQQRCAGLLAVFSSVADAPPRLRELPSRSALLVFNARMGAAVVACEAAPRKFLGRIVEFRSGRSTI